MSPGTDMTSSAQSRCIGISVSDSPDASILGLSDRHLRDVLVELSRSMLAAGDTLAYGGDLRAHGFTKVLFELTARYGRGNGVLVTNYLPWPVHHNLSDAALEEVLEEASSGVDIIRLDLEGNPTTAPKPRRTGATPEEWARGLTGLRETLARVCDARVVLGGPVEGFRGKNPGIAEEAYLAMRQMRPVFLIGAFGGCARDLCETFGLAARLPWLGSSRDWPGRSMFADYGPSALNNGLSDEENRRLAVTPHTDEIVTLVRRGLGRRSG